MELKFFPSEPAFLKFIFGIKLITYCYFTQIRLILLNLQKVRNKYYRQYLWKVLLSI